jgi:hypothetical protein
MLINHERIVLEPRVNTAANVEQRPLIGHQQFAKHGGDINPMIQTEESCLAQLGKPWTALPAAYR